MTPDEALAHVRTAQAAQREHDRVAAAESSHLADRTAAAVAELVAACGTQTRAAELLGIGQARVAQLAARARGCVRAARPVPATCLAVPAGSAQNGR
jgi:DNA-directed RNA polymerase specialized sigma subunit